MTTIGFCVSGGGLAFRACVAAAREGLISARIGLLVCDRPSTAIDYARANRVPDRLLPFEDFAERRDFDRAIETALNETGCDWLLLNFNRLLARSTIDLLAGRAINLHLSLLPAFPGFGAVRKALASDMRVAGVTFHLVDAGTDSGRILLQGVAPILPGDGVEELTARLYWRAVPMQLHLCRLISESRIDPEKGLVMPTGDHQGQHFPPVPDDILQFSRAFLGEAGLPS